ncbi:DUF5677 domain-containing protein [Candidatus Riflebacteria bacterium]
MKIMLKPFYSEKEIIELECHLKYLEEIQTYIYENISKLENESEVNKKKKEAISRIFLSQFFTFSSILSLLDSYLFADAFSLLRVLYEGNLRICQIGEGGEKAAIEFFATEIKDQYRKYNEMKNANFYESTPADDILFKKLEMDSIKAKERIGKVNWGRKERLEQKDNIKQSPLPTTMALDGMYARIWSIGSEYLHRSSLGISDGYLLSEKPENSDYPFNRIPSIKVGLETANWSSDLILTSFIFYSDSVNVDLTPELAKLHLKKFPWEK